MNLRDLARGKHCQIRIPTVCNGNPETTVLCHYRLGGLCGIGMKPPDWLAAWGCSDCHNAVDGRTRAPFDREQLRLWFAEGCFRTIAEIEKLKAK